MIKVSIIVPAYNAEKHIKNCINNLLKQAYKNIEIIVVNDASSDNTLNIINSINSKYLKVINLSENSGAYYARKIGLKNSVGDYILFVDSDDYLENDTIANLVKYVEEYKADIVKFRYIKEPSKIESSILFKDEEKPFLIKNKKDIRITDELINTINLNSLWSMIIKRDLITDDGITRRFSLGEDHIQACYIYSNANRILFVNDIYYHYCDNPMGTIKNINENSIKNNLVDLLYSNELLHDIIKNWNLEDKYYNLVDSRTFNGITDILMSKMCSRKKYNKMKADLILKFLFLNDDYIELKNRISSYKILYLFKNKRKGLKKTIFNYYKKQLYKGNIKKMHFVGFLISKL